MAVMVNGGGAGGGGGWINITDSVTLGRGQAVDFDSGDWSYKVRSDNENYAYVLIENVQAGERYRVTGWTGGSPMLAAGCLDSNNKVLYGSERSNGTESRYDAYAGTKLSYFYCPLEIAIPKIPGITKLMVSHNAIAAGSTYDDVIVEKYIG